MIGNYYNQTATVTRLATTSGYKKSFSAVIQDLPCYIQPQDASLSSNIEGSFGKNSLLLCDTADIRDGDKIEATENGASTKYKVVGVQRFDTGNHKHMEVLINTFEA